MNSAILAFKRYEEASLSYTGLDKHENERVGGWDTTFTVEEMRSLLQPLFDEGFTIQIKG